MPYPPSAAPTWSSRSARFPQPSPSLDYRCGVIGLVLRESVPSRSEARGPDARVLEVAAGLVRVLRGDREVEFRTRRCARVCCPLVVRWVEVGWEGSGAVGKADSAYVHGFIGT
jgi:hypothetical protein